MATIAQALELEQIETDIFRGPVIETQLPRTFGGQVAGQSLVAAVRTVDAKYRVHSLHAYFLRPGIPTIPAVYLVDRIRDGRSFCTRRVTGIQNGEAIFTMSASFHAVDEGIEHHDPMPVAPLPDELPDPREVLSPERQWVLREWDRWDIRFVPTEAISTKSNAVSQQQVWFKYRETLPDDPTVHACTLAYMSDMTLLGAARVTHPDEKLMIASLDHALWFMRPFRADEWLLYAQTSPSAQDGRALTEGRIFDLQGNLVACVVQEGLTRLMRQEFQP